MTRARRLNILKGSGVHPILRSIRHEASSRLIPVGSINGKKVNKVFRRFNAYSKYEIASMLSEVFPELLWKLPPKRKIWQSEHPRMALFDAVALGFAYWERTVREI